MNDHQAGPSAPYGVAPHGGDQDPAGPQDRNDIRPVSRTSPPARHGIAKRAAVALDALDGMLAVISGLMVIFVHDVHYLLTAPYWMDEAWVADSTRAPLGQVARLASSTPYGWTLLLRLVPGGHLERQRLVPLAFAALAVAFGYLLGRELRLTRVAAGLLTAAAVLLSPVMLVRDDLKQYTAEACAAVLLWLGVARLENAWSRWRLAGLALATALGTLFAETAIITGGAAVACLSLEAVIRRQWRRLAEVAVAGAGTLAIYAVIFVVLVKPRVNPRLSVYWEPFYSPSSAPGAASFFWRMVNRIATSVGFPAAHSGSALLLIPLVLACCGILALVLLQRYALAAMLPVTLVVVMAGSAARQYPFGDQRTSTFWAVMVPVLMAIAVAAAISYLGRLGDRTLTGRRPRGTLPAGGPDPASGTSRARGGRLPQAVIAVVVGTAAIAGYLHEVRPDVNSRQIAHEDVRSQVDFVEAHLRPGDVIVANYGAGYGFAYYYPQAPTAYPDLPASATGFTPQYPGNARVIVISAGYPTSVVAAFNQALAALGAEPPASRGRIWVIRQHAYAAEVQQWQALYAANIRAGGTVTTYHLNKLGYVPGFEPVVLYALPPQRRRPPAAPPPAPGQKG
jgi:hypothetical protein